MGKNGKQICGATSDQATTTKCNIIFGSYCLLVILNPPFTFPKHKLSLLQAEPTILYNIGMHACVCSQNILEASPHFLWELNLCTVHLVIRV